VVSMDNTGGDGYIGRPIFLSITQNTS